jgi:protein-disulfide isomerase
LIEVFDFSCGHCANYYLDIGRLLALEVEPGNARFEWVLTGSSEPTINAGLATLCATEQGAGYDAYKILFNGFLTEGRDYSYSRDGIDDLLGGGDLGLDMEALNACIDDGTYVDALDAMRARSAELEVTGTPSVLFSANGEGPAFLTFPGEGEQRWSGTIPIEVVRTVIDLLSEGVPIADVLNQ